jgi:hypothetical protein
MTRSFSDLLDRILDEGAPLPDDELCQLSDMPEQSAARIAAVWPTISVHRRRDLMRRLADACQDDFSVDYAPLALLVGLQDVDSLVRLAAIDTFWDSEDQAVIAPLMRLMGQDPDLTVRAGAAQALGQFVLLGELGRLAAHAFDQVVRALLAVADDERAEILVRCRALESVAAADLDEVAPLIRQAYRSGQEPFRISAVSAMGRTGDEQWESIVLTELENVNPSMRYQAAVAAGQLELGDAVAQLIHLLDDPDPAVTRASIWSLGEIGDPEAASPLEQFLDDVELGDLAQHAMDAIELAVGRPVRPRFHAGWVDEDAIPD